MEGAEFSVRMGVLAPCCAELVKVVAIAITSGGGGGGAADAEGVPGHGCSGQRLSGRSAKRPSPLGGATVLRAPKWSSPIEIPTGAVANAEKYF